MSTEEKLKVLIEAVENVLPLLSEGISSTQEENWSKEIDDLFAALTIATT